QASLTITAQLVNHTPREVSGIVKGKIGSITLEQPFRLKPSGKKTITFNPRKYNQLNMKNPRLWWPNNLGKPHLYRLDLAAIVDKHISHHQQVIFGIREVSDYLNEQGHRGYKINGKEILIRGGGWVDDLLLENDPHKIEAQIKYARHMNLNTIRLEGFWGSSRELYHLADRYGILVMPGWSCQWEWQGLLGKPVDQYGGLQTAQDIQLVVRSLRDQVLWLRNHPSIFVWVLASDKLPRPQLEKEYNTSIAQIDPTRPLLASCKTFVSKVSGPTAVKMNGPYDYVPPVYWYTDKKNGGAFGFNTETGPGPQPPPLESLRRMIPPDRLWPINDVWEYHCAGKKFNTLQRYTKAFNQRYGEARSVEEFTQKAQAANYEAMRAMFEAFGINKPNTTGIIQWMLNSAWPQMFWQLYDYYLMPNGAFYGAKTGSQPLNIAYHYGNHSIHVVNDT
ncbi:MAG: glycoside hydrolase family 2, partial [bacterium]|nr:glycoside hydrolase family 2 [bacterium]